MIRRLAPYAVAVGGAIVVTAVIGVVTAADTWRGAFGAERARVCGFRPAFCADGALQVHPGLLAPGRRRRRDGCRCLQP